MCMCIERGREGESVCTLIHISMTAPLDLLTFGRYNFAAIQIYAVRNKKKKSTMIISNSVSRQHEHGVITTVTRKLLPN